MIHLDITLLIGTAIVSIYFFSSNLKKRFKYAVNKLFAFGCIVNLLLVLSLLYQILNNDSEYLTYFSRIIYCLLMLLVMVAFSIAQIFPRWEKRTPLWAIIASAVPGTLVITLTAASDFIIKASSYSEAAIETFGKYAIIYAIIYALYLVGGYFSLVYKSRILDNEAFKKQMIPFQMGLGASLIWFLIFYVIFPNFFDIFKYKNIGIAGLGIISLSVINYGLSDESLLNFKKFFLKIFISSSIVFLLFLPVYFALERLTNKKIAGVAITPFLGSLIISVLLVILYRILKPISDLIINKKDKALQKNFGISFNVLSKLSGMNKQKMDWKPFFIKTIDNFCNRMKITNATVYLLNKDEKFYQRQHFFNEGVQILSFTDNDSMIKCAKKYKHCVEKSMFYTDENLSEFKNDLLELYSRYNIKVALPLFNHDKVFIGLILIGSLAYNEPYSIDFISLLDMYRIQLSIAIESSLLSEQIRETQVIKRDKMVVRNIKKKIIPAELKEINGLRISSLYINNSDYGGDYFDTVRISNEKIGVFISNSSDAGIESAMLSLQLHAVLNTQVEKYDSPEVLLNTMSQVLSASRFTSKYATGLYLTYSFFNREIKFANAAYNPLIIFEPTKDKFTEFDAEGIPIGLDRNFHYEFKTTIAPPNCICYLYSDGLSSSIDKDGNNYSINRIKDIIMMNKNDTPSVLIRKIYADYKNFIGEKSAFNDVCLILFRID